MGEMLKSAASARSEVSTSSSFTSSTNDAPVRAPSPGRSPPSRRHSASHLPALGARCAAARPVLSCHQRSQASLEY